MLTDIPNELIDMIIQKLDKKDAISVTSVSSGLRQFYSKYLIRKSVFNVDDLYSDSKINFKLSDVTELRGVDEKSIELITAYTFPNLKKITFNDSFNLPISKYNLPNSLEYVEFGKNYNNPISVKTDDKSGGVPLNLKSIVTRLFCFPISIDGGLKLRCLSSIDVSKMLSFEDSNGDPVLPITVKDIRINNYYGNLESKTGKKLLPPFLESLIIAGDNLKIVSNTGCKSLLPHSLKKLSLGYLFNQPLISDVNNVPLLPPSLEILHLDGMFNQEIVSYVGDTIILLLPPSLKCLTFKNFNRSIISNSGKPLLPLFLEELSLGDHFNQPFFDENDNLALDLPNLTFLNFGSMNHSNLYNRQGKSIIPRSVIDLKFNYHSEFNKSLCNELGESMLPPKLKILSLPTVIYNSLTDYIHLLPMTLEWIQFNNDFNEPLDSLVNFKNRSVKTLIFGCNFNQPIQTEDGVSLLPDSIIDLNFGSSFNQPIHNRYGKSMLPPNLQGLYFGTSFNQPIIKSVLSASLEHLRFLSDFNQQLCNFNEESVLPPNLKSLTFGYSFNQVVQTDFGIPLIPDTVTCLRFGKSFNQAVVNQYGSSMLPLNLENLYVGQDFKQSFQNCKGKSIFSSKLKYITFTKYYNKNIYSWCGKLLWDCTDQNTYNNKSRLTYVSYVDELLASNDSQLIIVEK